MVVLPSAIARWNREQLGTFLRNVIPDFKVKARHMGELRDLALAVVLNHSESRKVVRSAFDLAHWRLTLEFPDGTDGYSVMLLRNYWNRILSQSKQDWLGFVKATEVQS